MRGSPNLQTTGCTQLGTTNISKLCELRNKTRGTKPATASPAATAATREAAAVSMIPKPSSACGKGVTVPGLNLQGAVCPGTAQPTDGGGEGGRTQATAARAAAEGPAPQAAAHTSPIHTSKVTLSRKCHHPILAATQMTMLDFSQFSFEFFNRLIHSCALTYEREKLLYHSSTCEVMFSDLQKGLQPELEIKLELLK